MLCADAFGAPCPSGAVSSISETNHLNVGRAGTSAAAGDRGGVGGEDVRHVGPDLAEELQ